MTPVLRGAANKARPVGLVTTWSPFEKFTVTPGVKRPLTSRTARVAVSPETMRFGSSRVRAAEAGGACWADSAKEGIAENAHKKRYAYTDGRESIVRL